MKHVFRLTFAVLFSGALAIAAPNPTHAITSNGPYYAEPSWDQKLDPATRSVVLSNWNEEAVLDRETGLVWEKSPLNIGNLTWTDARHVCVNRTTGGRKSWRLASVHELTSLVEPANSNPALPTGHLFLNAASSFWSATTKAEDRSLAWFVVFGAGGASGDDKTETRRAWCVRGGGPHSEY